jgi:hypothetical protein
VHAVDLPENGLYIGHTHYIGTRSFFVPLRFDFSMRGYTTIYGRVEQNPNHHLISSQLGHS